MDEKHLEQCLLLRNTSLICVVIIFITLQKFIERIIPETPTGLRARAPSEHIMLVFSI